VGCREHADKMSAVIKISIQDAFITSLPQCVSNTGPASAARVILFWQQILRHSLGRFSEKCRKWRI
jgi:hypothetical protein